MSVIQFFLIFFLCLKALSFDRAISTLPSITQVFNYLEAEDKLVGVSKYCSLNKAKIGDSYQLNFEKMMTLNPDIVYLSSYVNPKKLALLNKADISYKIINQGRLKDIFKSIETIGKDLNLSKSVVEKKLKTLKSHYHVKDFKLSSLKSIFILGDDVSLGEFKRFYIAAKDSVFHDLLDSLGLMSATSNIIKPNVQWNMEKVYKENPSLILHLIPESSSIDRYKKMWSKHSGLKAVKNRKIFLLQDSSYFVTGPYIYKLLNKIKRLLKGRDKCCSL